jgi:hypothetical protein
LLSTERNWSMEERMRRLTLAPVIAFAAVAAGIGVLTLASSQARSAPHVHATVTRAERLAAARREELQQSFDSCLTNMGGDYSGFRTRFSPPPDMHRIRDAISVCRTVLETGSDAPAGPRGPLRPPVL